LAFPFNDDEATFNFNESSFTRFFSALPSFPHTSLDQTRSLISLASTLHSHALHLLSFIDLATFDLLNATLHLSSNHHYHPQPPLPSSSLQPKHRVFTGYLSVHCTRCELTCLPNTPSPLTTTDCPLCGCPPSTHLCAPYLWLTPPTTIAPSTTDVDDAPHEAEVIVRELEERCKVAVQVAEEVRALGRKDGWKETRGVLTVRVAKEVEGGRGGW
jgi:hypothetical protein